MSCAHRSNKIRSKTSNGINAEESGELKPNPAPKSAEDPAAFIAVRGSYSYTADDGVVYTVNYIADENGFQPSVRLIIDEHLSNMNLNLSDN